MNASQLIGKRFIMIASLAMTIAVSELEGYGQRPSYPIGRRIERINRQADQYERDHMLVTEKKSSNANERQRVQSVMNQVKEDFGRLQSFYNEIVVAVSAGKKLDPAFITESVAGINKCATRLKTNLALPESKDKASGRQNVKDGVRSQPSLTVLLNQISEFVTNPMFESSAVLDIELSTKASRNLEEIISMSETIRKAIDRPR